MEGIVFYQLDSYNVGDLTYTTTDNHQACHGNSITTLQTQPALELSRIVIPVPFLSISKKSTPELFNALNSVRFY